MYKITIAEKLIQAKLEKVNKQVQLLQITMDEIKLKLISQQARIPLNEALYVFLPEGQIKIKNIF